MLNNNSHESVGGYKTHCNKINIKDFSKSIGFKDYFHIDKKSNLNKKIKIFLKSKGPSFLEVIIKNKGLNPEYSGDPSRLIKEIGNYSFIKHSDSIKEMVNFFYKKFSINNDYFIKEN